jgi:hypothetical protein
VPVPNAPPPARASLSGDKAPQTRDALDAERIAAEIRRHPVFAGLDAATIARRHADRLMTAPQKLEWVLGAIDKCAAANEGQGLMQRELQKLLTNYMHRADESDVVGKSPRTPAGEAPNQRPKAFDLSQYQGLRSGRENR